MMKELYISETECVNALCIYLKTIPPSGLERTASDCKHQGNKNIQQLKKEKKKKRRIIT